MAIAQPPLPRLNQIAEHKYYLWLQESTVYMGLYETIHRSFVPFQTRVIVRSVPQIQRVISDLASNPHHSSALATSHIIYIYIYKKREGYFQRKKKEIGLPAFRPTEKSRSSLPDWRSQLADDTEGYFKPLLKKKRRRNSEKKQSPTNSYTPFSTLTLIVPSILRNFQRTRTIPQTWHAPELIPVPGMWRRERDTFTGLSFFFPLNLGSEVTTVEKVEKEAVCHRKPCLQKSRILSQRDKQGKQLSVRSAVMFFWSEIFTGWLPALCTAIAV